MEEIEKIVSNCFECVKKPCQLGCPLSNDTAGFIKLVKEKKYKEAYELCCETTVLQAICGRICPHESQCQGSCIRRIKDSAVEIGKVEAFLGDMAIEKGWDIPKFTYKKKDKKIAVVGGGPAGLTCSAFLARNGYAVTIYEKHGALGGIPEHGIPEFRLDQNILKKAIDKILELGIEVKYNTELGKDISIQKLEKEYDVVFISIGANVSTKMGIKGENLPQVLGGNELLENKEYPNFNGRKVAVIGGGNVAMDVSRTVKRLGAKDVTVIYRRSKDEMPAEEKEIQEAEKEGIEFMYQTNILKILGDTRVEKVESIKTELVQKEGESRKVPINVENSNFFVETDYVIMAVGSKADKQIVDKLEIKTDNKGKILIDENCKTSREKVFAGGNIAGAKDTVAWAARSRKKCSIQNRGIFEKRRNIFAKVGT